MYLLSLVCMREMEAVSLTRIATVLPIHFPCPHAAFSKTNEVLYIFMQESFCKQACVSIHYCHWYAHQPTGKVSKREVKTHSRIKINWSVSTESTDRRSSNIKHLSHTCSVLVLLCRYDSGMFLLLITLMDVKCSGYFLMNFFVGQRNLHETAVK